MFTGFVAIFYLSNCQRWDHIIFNDDFQCLEKFFDDFFKSGWVDFIFGMYYNLINTQISCIIYTKERVNDIIGRT